ncbi:helix-turn-helix domain-containing protein [Lacticaseibacillus absianus]|uniref:helix-turn-helix domain-containing protein n=1 Tax=Lacticaseibacillus absianus TaxID=2729623 RepID=UPI0015C97D09|nr:helix-turn-helix domain-containing protein [Lacticaseibacillus absianus]
MRFEEIFLEKADLQKFEMFRLLASQHHDALTITDLSARMRLSYQQTYNIFQELLGDVISLTGETRAAAKRLLIRGSLELSLDSYRCTLLGEAVAFQFMDYLAQTSQPSVDQFAADHFISHSTLLRKTTTLRKFLGQYRIKVSLTQAKFTGDEKQIRLFLQAMYWLGYRGLKWPFRAIDQQALAAQYRVLPNAATEPIRALQEQVFWAVCRTRIAHGCVVRWSAPATQLFAGYPVETTLYPAPLFPRLTPQELLSESSFFEFFQHKNLRFTPITPQEDQLLNYLKRPRNPGWVVVERMMAALSAYDAEAAAPLWEDPQLVMNMLRLATAFFVLDGNYVKQADFFASAQLTYRQTQLRALLAQAVAELPQTSGFTAFHRDQAQFVELAFFLFVPYLHRFRWGNTVKVKLVMATSDIVNGEIREFLANIHIVQILPHDAPMTGADLIVTAPDDFIAPEQVFQQTDAVTFNWYLNATETDYYLLYQQIYQLYQAKLRPTATPQQA